MGRNKTRGSAVCCFFMVAGMALLFGYAEPLWAQASNPAALEEIIIISSRVPQPQRQSGVSVSVLEAEQIAAQGNMVLSEVLRQLPAVSVSSPGGAGQTSSVRIRGEEGYRTLTILDGLRLSDPSGPQIGPHFEHLMSNGINRVEVLRGPQGLAYGADAGGVINISTRQAEQGFGLQLEAQQGTYGTSQQSVGFGGSSDAAAVSVDFADFSTNGFNAQASDKLLRDDDGYHNTTLHVRGAVQLTPALTLEAVHRQVDGTTASDGCYSSSLVHDCSSLFDQTASRVALGWQGSAASHSLAFSTTATRRDYLAEAISTFRTEGELQRVEYLGVTSVLPLVDLVFGADLERAITNGSGRDNRGVHIEALGALTDTVQLNAGVRHDSNDDFGSNSSYRLGGSWLLARSNSGVFRLRGSLGSGFRAPSPFEIAYNKGPFASAPANQTALAQETSKGWEAGIDVVLKEALQLEAVYFNQRVEDAIVFDLSYYSGYLQEFGRSSSNGVELAGAWQMGEHWHVRANFTWNHTERPNGLQRLRRPLQLGNLGLSWRGLQQKLDLNAHVRSARNSTDESAGLVQALEDVAVLDLGARLQVSEYLQLFARLENALDRQYQEAIDYHSPGRSAFLGFRYQYSNR